MPPGATRNWQFAALCSALALASCKHDASSPALSRHRELVRTAPVPPENGPLLGVVSETLPVHAATSKSQPELGTLRAGARIPRSERAVSSEGCEGGWYAIRPFGFVCVGRQATLDMSHPTLGAMALRPNLDAALPYTYARGRGQTVLWERQGALDAVREFGKLPRRSGMAVVGSWQARDEAGTELRLALLTSGRFVKAEDLEAAKASSFQGVELDGARELPVAFVVKRGVRTFRMNGSEPEKADLLEYHAMLPLSGRFRNSGGIKYWALAPAKPGAPEELWVRHRDVTVIQQRSVFPDFVEADSRWLDVSVVTGTLVAYQGRRAVFATLVSVVRELPASSETVAAASSGSEPLPLGSFVIQRKHLTFTGKPRYPFQSGTELLDVPWVLELDNGQLLHAAYWHDRFGMEHGEGNVALAPADAARLFRFVTPELPPGWHAAVRRDIDAQTRVVIRK